MSNINVRRLQDTLAKKNTYSLNIDRRNLKNGQVTATDAIARISDAELYGLTVWGADAAIKEFFTARADAMESKQDMYSKISKFGYCYLEELKQNPLSNQTTVTIDTYLLGSGIKSDILYDEDEQRLKNQLRKDTIKELKEDVYIPLTIKDVKNMYIMEEDSDDYNCKYMSFSKEGLNEFINLKQASDTYQYYTKINVKEIQDNIVYKNDDNDSLIVKLPINIGFDRVYKF